MILWSSFYKCKNYFLYSFRNKQILVARIYKNTKNNTGTYLLPIQRRNNQHPPALLPLLEDKLVSAEHLD